MADEAKTETEARTTPPAPPVIHEGLPTQLPDIDPDETNDWIDSYYEGADFIMKSKDVHQMDSLEALAYLRDPFAHFFKPLASSPRRRLSVRMLRPFSTWKIKRIIE